MEQEKLQKITENMCEELKEANGGEICGFSLIVMGLDGRGLQHASNIDAETLRDIMQIMLNSQLILTKELEDEPN